MTVRNRLWVSPMCQYSAETRDGIPNEWHLVHLGSFARGGAGLVMAEATGVTPEGRITGWCLGLWNDEQRDAFKPITRFIEQMGAVPAIQLGHAGRKGGTYRDWSGSGSIPLEDGGWETLAPSAIPFPGLATPRALTTEEVRGIVDAFAAAARRAVDAGFKVIEIHGAHGYLIHQFLSPLSNERDDEYGGSLENRARLLLEVVRAVRAELGEDVPVFVRLSATDWKEPEGWTLEQTQTVSAWARDAGADLIDVSTGGNVLGVKIDTFPSYQVPFAAAVREHGAVAVSAVGQIVDARQAEDIVASGKADAVMAGREWLRDPHFALRAAAELGVEDTAMWPPQYHRGTFAARPAL